jgi:hypothetical protein
MSKNNVMVDDAPVRDFYDELMDNANNDDAGSRLRAASMIMERCGDKEMADALGLLSAQMDFDDNEEASSAIERSRAKLDALIADRQSHRANRYIKSLRDEEILELSNGEVTEHDYDYLESMFCKNGLFDPDIFGGSGKIPYYDDENDKFLTKSYGTASGHIKLPIHVVLTSSYGTIADLLQMTEENVTKVMKYACYLVLDQGNSTLKKFDTISEAEYKAHIDAGEEFVVSMGGDAIYEALKSLGYADEPERLAFSVVPVTSPIVRPIAYSKEEDTFYSFPLNDRYNTIVTMSNRTKKLMGLGAPDIILRNESRMLDEAVNALVDAAKSSMKHTHWSKSSYHNFMRAQLGLILRTRNFALRRLAKEELNKTDEIESLHLFPEQIRLASVDGNHESISLTEVIDHNDGLVQDYRNDHMIFLPADVDEENLDDDTKKQIQDVDAELTKRENYSNDILSKAKSDRENCTVVIDNESGMYVLATA